MSHFRSCTTSGCHQTLSEVRDRFRIGRALDSALAGAMPVGNSLRSKPRLRVVLGQQFRLGLADVGKLCLQDLGNAPQVRAARRGDILGRHKERQTRPRRVRIGSSTVLGKYSSEAFQDLQHGLEVIPLL